MKQFFKYLALLLFSFFLFSGGCDEKATSENTTNQLDVTKEAQIDLSDFDKSWKQVEAFEKEGLYKSALKVVNEIMTKAKLEKNQPMEIKALIYQLKYNQELEENEFVLALNHIDELRKTNEEPLKQILASIKGELLFMYLQNNRYYLYNRTHTQDFDLKDVTTWDLKTLLDESNKLYLQSLENEKLLQGIPLENYKYILTDTSEEAYLTAPTLFDFLAHRALNNFANEETGITRPAAKFSFNDERYFGLNTFLTTSTESEDTLSQHLHYVKTMRKLLRFNLTLSYVDYDETASTMNYGSSSVPLLRNQLMLFQFAYKNATVEAKKEWYKHALLGLKKEYDTFSAVGEVNAALAKFYIDLAKNAQITHPDYFLLKEAHQLCSETIEKHPNTYGAELCTSLKQEIEEKQLSGNIESYHPSQQAILLQAKFKNLDDVYVQVYQAKMDNARFRLYEDDFNDFKLLSTKKIDLPATNDFQAHTTEIALDPLPYGRYMLVLTTDPTKKESGLGFHWITNIIVTDMLFSSREQSNDKTGCQVVNRSTGQAIVGATVKVLEKNGDLVRLGKGKLVKSYKTDENGWVEIPHFDEYNSRMFEIVNGNDVLISSAYLTRTKNDKKIKFSDYLFTDRLIYRPGQTIYFKGIRLKEVDKKSSIVTDSVVKITLKNVNRQDVVTLDLKCNEFGSYSGSFQIPTTGLTGRMQLSTKFGTIHFQVEEYKRPTFITEFETSADEYKLGETITVNGNARAYSGAAVDQATVKYVVKRSSSLPYWRAYSLGLPISKSESIISDGIVTTDEQGKFSIEFKAEKDATHHSAYTYTYSIEADVTDLNGETRSAKKQLTISESSVQLSVFVQATLDKTKKNILSVTTTNAEGKNISTKGTLVVSRIQPIEKITKKRSWSVPDKPLLTESEFNKLFPHLEYKPIDVVDRTAKEIEKITFDTEKSTDVILNTTNWETGEYKIETLVKDKYGVEVKDVQFVTLTDVNATKPPFTTVLHTYTLKNTFQPGETITVPISSSLQNQPILVEINVDGTIVETKHLIVNNEQKLLTFNVEEKHRGGLSIHLSTIKFGQVYSENLQFFVPYSNKELQVSFETFRDKLLPNEKEEWRLRITGSKKEKVAAEMLLTMYDASLDAFRKNSFNFNPHILNESASTRTFVGLGNAYSNQYGRNNEKNTFKSVNAPNLNWFGYGLEYNFYKVDGITVRGSRSNVYYAEEIERLPARYDIERSLALTPGVSMDNSVIDGVVLREHIPSKQMIQYEPLTGGIPANYGDITGGIVKVESNSNAPVPLRSNFNETAFFFPQLKTDANGDILVSFTVPESLTTWKVLGLAHTKDLEYALVQNEVVTQKELMVQTNVPRFIRSGDEVVLTAKVSNLTENVLNGTANIQLFDALTMQEVSSVFRLATSTTSFSSEAKQSSVVSWTIKAPENINSLVIRVTAIAQNHTDGEELTIPVLTDKVLVTESMPMTNNGKGAKDFVFTKLVNSKESGTLTHHSVTLEYTSNPAWYVIQALPYMLEYPYECSEQIFTRFYANAIASNIVRSSPKIKEVFDKWKNSSPDAFLSNLEKNQQLKSVILEETPWVLEAKDQSERKKRVALLFDFNRMDNELASNLTKLKDAQVSNGGFPWFPGMKESQYVTQYIVSGMGHLNQLGIVAVKENKDVQKMIQKAVKYLDARMLEDYNDLKKRKALTTDYFISQSQIQYMYARSFFTDIKLSSNEEEAFKFFKENAEKHWLKLNLNNQTMFALTSHRNGNTVLAEKIMNSVIERSITTEEMGMYWKENERGYYWYQAPIETQALIIEALSTIKKDQKAINNAKIWLLRNKQTSDWKTTTATANAAYALLIGGSTFTQQSGNVKIEINGKEIKPEDFGAQAEAGTGYFQKTWTGKEISADLGKVKVTRNDDGFSWGAMYWQYFESMDKVTSAETNLKLKKQLFVIRQTSSGEVIVPIKDGDKLKRGEKVRVRIELATDRNMEFVHMKDFRAAGFEPINVLSSYKWQGGLGYYENTRDVATHFFFDYLPKGNYVFEYDLRVSHSGDFSNGFATIQCMYAPEFTSHSNGVRVKVE